MLMINKIKVLQQKICLFQVGDLIYNISSHVQKLLTQLSFTTNCLCANDVQIQKGEVLHLEEKMFYFKKY